MSIKRVQPGDEFKPRAGTWNRFADAAERVESGGTSRLNLSSGRQWVVDVRNSSSDQTLKRFDAVEIGAPLIDDQANAQEFDKISGFEVDYPADPSAPGMMAILQDPIAPGKIGRAMIFGVSPAREISVVDELHTRATAGESGELVTSEDGPAVILWKSPATQGTRRAYVAILQGESKASSRWARLTGSTELGANRWEYDYELVELNDQGEWDTVTDDDDQPVTGTAINTAESGNSDTGIQGNGVDLANLPNGFEIVPIGEGAIVRVFGVGDSWLFTIANLVDGECGG